MQSNQKKLLLIDGNSLLFRAYYATMKNPLTDQHGHPTNAVYSFAKMLNKYFVKSHYDALIVTFDKGKKTFRHDLLDDYKAGRKKTPDDLVAQFGMAREFLTAANVDFYEKANYEADDLIGSIANYAVKTAWFVDILSSDQDLLQLINENVNVIQVKNFSASVRMDWNTFVDQYGFSPNFLIDYKGLKGDSSDNLKGIKGIGTKTATTLIQKYQTLENIFAHASETTGRLQKLLDDPVAQKAGLLSKQLATIVIDVPLAELALKPLAINWEQLNTFFLKYNMKSLVKQQNLLRTPSVEEKEIPFVLASWADFQPAEDNYLYVNENETLTIVNDQGTWTFALDFLKTHQAWLTFCAEAKHKKHGFDIKSQTKLIPWFDLKWWDDDIAVIGYVANTKLTPTVSEHSRFFLHKILGLPETKLNEQNSSVWQFNHDRSKLCQQLHLYHQQETWQASTLQKLYREVDRPIVNLLAKMEANGLKVDLAELERQSVVVQQELQRLTKAIYSAVGHEFNVNSPKQLAEVLYEDLQLPRWKKNSTAQAVLEKLVDQHPIVPLVLEYRKWHQMQSNYLEGLKKYLAPDGFIHCSFSQITVDTGRISCTQPNLQSIALHDAMQREVRKVFVPRQTNYRFLSFDYSQIELRIWTHWSQDPVLTAAFAADADIHQTVAAKIYQVSLEHVTSEMRSAAKAVNFGIMYGLQPFGLARMLGITVAEAKMFLAMYQEQYPATIAFAQKQIELVRQEQYAVTWFGRKRLVDEFQDRSARVRQFAERIAVNSPIQGTVSDLLKKGLLAVDHWLTQHYPKAYIVNQIHDEIMLEVPEEASAIIIAQITAIMEKIVTWSVPLKVNCHQGTSWYDLK